MKEPIMITESSPLTPEQIEYLQKLPGLTIPGLVSFEMPVHKEHIAAKWVRYQGSGTGMTRTTQLPDLMERIERSTEAKRYGELYRAAHSGQKKKRG